jgi:hypothetical protein
VYYFTKSLWWLLRLLLSYRLSLLIETAKRVTNNNDLHGKRTAFSRLAYAGDRATIDPIVSPDNDKHALHQWCHNEGGYTTLTRMLSGPQALERFLVRLLRVALERCSGA